MDELIALLGRNWRLLLLYPGGLAALVALLLARLLLEDRRNLRRGAERLRGREIIIAAAWLLTIALLPLPQTGWPYALDLLVLLALIELPHWTSIISTPDRAPDEIAAQLAPLLNVYPLLALSIALLGQAAGSLVVHEINRSGGWLHWLGIVGWASTLPPLLGLGPWRDRYTLGTLSALRRVAHMGLLLAAALPAHNETPTVMALEGFACLLLPLAALDRWWRGRSEWWIGWQPWLVVAFALVAASTSGAVLLARLR
ncbi:MAG TPA: hypothetical protein VFZ66_07465 [Herpetosiphonaceae bacterium]